MIYKRAFAVHVGFEKNLDHFSFFKLLLERTALLRAPKPFHNFDHSDIVSFRAERERERERERFNNSKYKQETNRSPVSK